MITGPAVLLFLCVLLITSSASSVFSIPSAYGAEPPSQQTDIGSGTPVRLEKGAQQVGFAPDNRLDYLLDPDNRYPDIGTLLGLTTRTPDSSRNIASLRWTSTAGTGLLHFANRERAVWLRFTLSFGNEGGHDWVLTLKWPFFTRAELYLVSERDGTILAVPVAPAVPAAAAAAFPATDPAAAASVSAAESSAPSFSLSGVPTLPWAFHLASATQDRYTCYLRVETAAKMIIPLQFERTDVFLKQNLTTSLFLGLFFGAMAAMWLYNLSLFIFIRDARFGYYVAYVATIILYSLGMTGLGTVLFPSIFHGVFPGTLLGIWQAGFGIFSSLSFLMASLFIRNFLQLQKHGGLLLHLANVVIVFWSLLMAGNLIATFARTDWIPWLLTLEDVGAIVSCLIGLCTNVVRWIRGDISAKYLTIAWSLLILTTIVLMLGLTGELPFTPLVRHCQSVGILVEVVLLSVAVAEQINRVWHEKEEARYLSLRLFEKLARARQGELEAQQHSLEVERQAKQELEARVVERTRELRHTLEALELANSELAELSVTDGLTGLANRRHFDESFTREFKRAMRHQEPLGVILGDVDHFKTLNDRYGHLVGDEALRVIAALLRSRRGRAEDVVARYGGEEFVVLLPGAGLADTGNAAEWIRREVEQHDFIVNGRQVRLSLSLGAVSAVPKENDAPEQLLAKADSALYQAKAAGRNRVVCG